MKTKIKLPIVIQASIITLVISYSNLSLGCTPDSTSPSGDCSNLVINSNAGVLVNNYTISATGSYAVRDTAGGTFSLFTNNGTINSGTGAAVAIGTVVGNFVNNGTIGSITPIAGSGGLYVGGAGSIVTLTNTGSITPTLGNAIQNFGNIDSIINSGVISSGSTFGIANSGTIGSITNTGRISGSVESIQNGGTIGTINNSNGSLFYNGILPGAYNVIINSPLDYGQFRLQTGSGATTFGVYAGSQITTSTYATVLNGLTGTGVGGNLTSTTGTYQGMTWTLVDAGGALWDLIFSGTNTAVMSALNQTTTALQNVFTLQNTVLVNGFTYDCPVFDKNNVCVSVGARSSAVNTDSVNSTGGLLIGAYRLNNQVRLGAYIDQNISTNSTGIVKVANASPMVGVFGVWSERLDGTGTEVKVSAGYGQKNTTMTRPVVDGTEAGSGSSTLTSQGVQAIGKYGFAVADKTIVSPYVGLRYTQNNMGGYTEGSSASVTAPLTYSAVNTNATTVVAGLGANYKVMPDVTLLASAGLENDLSTSNGTFSATGLYGINPINFNSNPVRTRATASAGAYYDLAKNQRVSLSYIFRQEQFQGVNTNAAFLTYIVGL
jgi:Autotransporter beta-domain